MNLQYHISPNPILFVRAAILGVRVRASFPRRGYCFLGTSTESLQEGERRGALGLQGYGLGNKGFL